MYVHLTVTVGLPGSPVKAVRASTGEGLPGVERRDAAGSRIDRVPGHVSGRLLPCVDAVDPADRRRPGAVERGVAPSGAAGVPASAVDAARRRVVVVGPVWPDGSERHRRRMRSTHGVGDTTQDGPPRCVDGLTAVDVLLAGHRVGGPVRGVGGTGVCRAHRANASAGRGVTGSRRVPDRRITGTRGPPDSDDRRPTAGPSRAGTRRTCGASRTSPWSRTHSTTPPTRSATHRPRWWEPSAPVLAAPDK